jgi:uncharacterized protein
MATGPQRDYLGRAQMPAGARAAEIDAGLRAYMQKVFGLMAGGVALSGLVSFGIYQSEAIMTAILTNTLLFWAGVLVPIGFGLVLTFKLRTLTASTAQTMFWIYAGLMGVFLAIATFPYTGESVARALFVSAAMFAGTALWGYTTKRDLTSWGSFLFMGLLGVFIAIVVNFFLQSPALYWAISIVGVIVFVGLTAYDTQKIKESFDASDGTEIATKKAVWGALELYLDFINLFLFLLRLIGERR